jgi:toxin ParE1/3/4
MAFTIVLTFRARLQVLDINDYLSERNPTAAERFRERLDKAYQQLSDFPLSGRRGLTPNMRRLILRPYIITYRVVPTGVEILDIRHGRQRPPALPEED